jgi:ASPIC and UnbV/Secretion system C-terminal sorting domain
MINNGDMTFSPASCPFYFGPSGDLNHDGYLDFYSENNIYYNTLEGNNWLIVSTVGTTSNKNGIGARVTVNSALGSQIRDIRSAQAFSPMQTLNAHFGLAQDMEISSISVCWPSGEEDVIYNPSINTHLTIVEGSTINVAESTKEQWLIYPNPAVDRIQIKGEAARPGAAFRITDNTGRLVVSQVLTGREINVTALPAGMYTLSLMVNGAWEHSVFTK